MELPLPNLPDELDRLLDQIPLGAVTTYGDLADALGARQAARWVGEYLLHHIHHRGCPCHRVVRTNGDLGRYIEDEQLKKRLLRRESIPIVNGRVDLERSRFNDFESDRPLAALVHFQEQMPKRTKFTPFRATPRYVGGIDAAYDKDNAVAAYVLVDVLTGEVAWSTTICRPVEFPYIPGFLSFRESPLLLELLTISREQKKLADVVIVDGNGLLHPRFAGIASHVGVLSETRTIGIGKKLLCGSADLAGMKADDPRPVIFQERLVGMAWKATPASRPIFVSPGHQIDVAGAMRIVRRLSFGHRVPEPNYHADALSRKAARNRKTARFS